MAITYENFGQLYVPGLKKVFFGELENYILRAGGEIIPKIYGYANDNIASLDFVDIPGLSMIPEFNGTVQNVDTSVLYEKSIVSKEYSSTMPIPRKMIDDNKYANATRWSMLQAQSVAKRYLSIAHSPFNNAEDSSKYKGFDDLSLASTSHPYGNGSDVQSNKGSSALSYDAVIAANNAMKGFKDHNGDPMGISGKLILCSDKKEATAIEIINALAKPGTANNTANAVKDMGFSYIATPWLSNDDNWFLIDPSLSPMHLIFHDRIKPEFNNDYDRRTHTNNLNVYTRFGNGFLGWQWVYCSIV